MSIPMGPGMTVWPGDRAFEFSASSRISEGAGCNVSEVTFVTHAGTHMDAPWHFEDGGKKLHEMDSSVFFGDALLIDLPDVDIVTAGDLGSAPLPRRVLFKTRNSTLPVNGPFARDYVALSPDASRRCVDDGVKLVGVDYLSVAPFHQPGQETHHILLGNDVLVVEGLVLKGLRTGTYPFVVLPLPLLGADGAPCRAFIGDRDLDS
ncbi:MAG: cyclase family protein [Candidatus Hydrogenedentes bacterium]|nr:cyclase family protein [Candidatus Hydrogenedentota bacterium]